MTQLIKNIEGQVLTNITSEINYLKPIIGEIQREDYIKLNNLIAYLQNLTSTKETVSLKKPNNFGLPNNYNIEMITLEIDY